MIKTVKVCRMEDEKEDCSWALALDDSERIALATRLVERSLVCGAQRLSVSAYEPHSLQLHTCVRQERKELNHGIHRTHGNVALVKRVSCAFPSDE